MLGETDEDAEADEDREEKDAGQAEALQHPHHGRLNVIHELAPGSS